MSALEDFVQAAALVERVLAMPATRPNLGWRPEVLTNVEASLEIALGTLWLREARLVLERFTPAVYRRMGGVQEAADDLDFIEAAQGQLTPVFEAKLRTNAMTAMAVGHVTIAERLALNMSFQVRHRESVDYLVNYGAARVAGINRTTKEQMGMLIAEGVSQGDSYQKVARRIAARYAGFSTPSPLRHIRSRAELVAVTEMGNAYVHQNLVVARDLKNAGLKMEKRWLVTGDNRVCSRCLGNQADGWIDLEEDFRSGHGAPTGHPGCRCDIQIQRRGPVEVPSRLVNPYPDSRTHAKALIAMGQDSPAEIARKLNEIYGGNYWNGQRISDLKSAMKKAGELPGTVKKVPGGPGGVTRQPRVPKAPDPRAWPEGGFKTRTKMEAWLTDKYPNIRFDLRRIDLDVLNDTMKEFDRLAGKYPEVAARLRHVTSNPKLAGRMTGVNYRGFKGEYAHATTDGRLIGLNPSHYSDGAKIRKMVRSDASPFASKMVRDPAFPDRFKYIEVPILDQPKMPWHPIGSENVESIMTHEFGHQVDHWLKTKTHDTIGKVAMDAQHERSVAGYHRRFMNDVLAPSRVDVSEYARKSSAESWAEHFSQRELGDPKTWNPRTKALDDYLDTVTPAANRHDHVADPYTEYDIDVLNAKEVADNEKKNVDLDRWYQGLLKTAAGTA